LFRCRNDCDCRRLFRTGVSVLKRLPAFDCHGFELPFPENDFDFESAEKKGILFLDFFEVVLQE
jgi:hypothetical protein